MINTPVQFIYGILIFVFFNCSQTNSSIPNLENRPSGIKKSLQRNVSIFQQTGNRPIGSGFLINSKGFLISCLHVVQPFKNKLRISINGQDFYQAIIIKESQKLDLVILKSNLKIEVSQPKWIKADEIHVGEKVYTFAAPWGLYNSYLEGYVAHQNRVAFDIQLPKIKFIQTMGLSFPGSSGAPVYNIQGHIIGINRSTYGYVAGNGIGFTIPSSQIQEFLKLPDTY